MQNVQTTTTIERVPKQRPYKAIKAAALLIPAALFALGCWGVFLGGLASLQNSCHSEASGRFVDGVMNLGPIDGFSAYISDCHNVFQFWWWIVALEIVLLISLIATAGAGKGYLGRHTFLGLFVVATVLYILASHVFLLMMSIEYFHESHLIRRARATIAGAILTAIANFVMIIVLGHPGNSDNDLEVGHHKQLHDAAQLPAAIHHV